MSTDTTFKTDSGKLCIHGSNHTDDSTYVLSSSGERLFTVDADAIVYDKDGKRIGKFRTDGAEYWYFKYDGVDKSLHFGNKNLIKSEIKLFKMLIK